MNQKLTELNSRIRTAERALLSLKDEREIILQKENEKRLAQKAKEKKAYNDLSYEAFKLIAGGMPGTKAAATVGISYSNLAERIRKTWLKRHPDHYWQTLKQHHQYGTLSSLGKNPPQFS